MNRPTPTTTPPAVRALLAAVKAFRAVTVTERQAVARPRPAAPAAEKTR